MKPLKEIIVLDFSQYLAGPSAALRLADLGARVIKVENPKTGDKCRQLTINNMVADGDGVNFYAINRDKESFAANMKEPEDLEMVRRLVAKADVLIENFRPGVMKKFGLDYESVREFNPGIVYASITGYGTEGPWKGKPGQDLLVQAMSGLAYLNGNADQPPTPFGISIADTITGTHAVDGILACLTRRRKTGIGGHVEVSLMESILFMQVESLTTYLNDGHELPVRCKIDSAHAYIAAPYGIYRTKDSYIAISMGSVVELGKLIGCPELLKYTNPDEWISKRDEIKAILVDFFVSDTTAHWLSILESAGFWASDVLPWNELMEHDGFKVLDFVQEVQRPGKPKLYTTRCPIRYNGQLLKTSKSAPRLGEDNEKIMKEFQLQGEGGEEK